MKPLGLVSVLLLGASAASVGLSGVESSADGERTSYLENGIVKVGVDLDRGGSIGFLADVKKGGGNVVNVHDLGRWIGQSYYSGPKPFGEAHPAWKDWPWNPVSAGDVYGNASRLLEKKNDGKTLYVKSIPMQWALKNVLGDCTFETWISLEGRGVRVRNRLTNHREDKKSYAAMDQELPAVYTTGKLHRLMSYVGDAPFSDKPVDKIPLRPARNGRPDWSTFFATEYWAALVGDDDWGLGVIHPDVVRFIGGFHGKPNTGGPDDDPTGYVAPVRQEVLDRDIVYEYSYTLVLDSLANIRREAYRQRPSSSVPDCRFTRDRQHCWLVNAQDGGIPSKGGWRLKLEADDPQIWGPEGFWQAKDAPTIFIRAAYRTTNKNAQLFWEIADKPGIREEQSVKFAIVPDGKIRTYEVNLSSSPNYRGAIRRFRFDPVETGRPGDALDLEYISAKME